MITTIRIFMASCLICIGPALAVAQGHSEHSADYRNPSSENSARTAQIVALDECDPTTFNAALGPDFCRNVSLAPLGFATTISDLFAKAAAGTPDPGWDFEPDEVAMGRGTVLSVTNQGGEPHTFTEVASFGGGFISDLNHGQNTVPECSGGFS